MWTAPETAIIKSSTTKTNCAENSTAVKSNKI